jgi:hypothetical protein
MRQVSDKVVTIHQPDFLPWLGFFDRWAKSDLYIILDDVQFLRRGWHHRDKIKTPQGVIWLTVPTRKKGRFDQQIKTVEIAQSGDWRRKHLETIRMAYKKAPNFSRIFPQLEEIYQRAAIRLIDFNLDLLQLAASELEINTPIMNASELYTDSSSTQRLVQLLERVSGTVYLTGLGSRAYLDENLFVQANIDIWWQDFQHPTYPQLHGNFQPNLSVLDYLMMREL